MIHSVIINNFWQGKKKTQNRTHISCLLGIPILPTFSKIKKNQEPSPEPPSQRETVYNTYLTLSSTASPLASASASSRSILALPFFRKKRRTKQNRMATAAMAELVANAVCTYNINSKFQTFAKKRETTYGVSRSVGRRVEVWWPDLGNVTLWFRFRVSHLEALKLIH